MPILCKAFSEGKPPLKFLSMARNRIEVKAVNVAESIRSLPNLEEFVIFHNGIKEEGMTALLQALGSLQKLKKLDIRDNFIIGSSLPELLKIIESENCVCSLNIGDCNVEENQNLEILESLKKAQDTKKWEYFGHNYNELYDEKIRKEFIDVLMKGGSLLVSFF